MLELLTVKGVSTREVYSNVTWDVCRPVAYKNTAETGTEVQLTCIVDLHNHDC